MTFSGIFAIGLSGVNAFATSLEAVSDNIANTQTTGFKRVRTDFSDLVSANAAGGGITGGGVNAVNRQLVSEQGAITRTSSDTDLAVLGDGFFVVSNAADSTPANDPFVFTRSGGFSAQADGSLVNGAGFFLRAAPIGADGAATAASLNGLETVNINRIPGLAEATSAITLAGNLDASAPVGAVVTQNFQIFDADGAARPLALTFTKTAANQWAATAAMTGAAPESLGAGAIVFDAAGAIDQAASSFPSTLTIASNAGQRVDLDLTSLQQTTGVTRFSTAAADGAAFASLSGVEISEDGVITGVFANGLKRGLYQIALANFTNPEGLDDGANSTFLLNSAAGDLELNIPQSGRTGAIESAALEISTADIGQEFSTLIATQRAYSANTRVISVADELWRTLNQTAA